MHGARVPHAQQAVAVFEPGKGPSRQNRTPARTRIVLDRRATGEMISCAARVAGEIAVPELPERIDSITLALPLPP